MLRRSIAKRSSLEACTTTMRAQNVNETRVRTLSVRAWARGIEKRWSSLRRARPPTPPAFDLGEEDSEGRGCHAVDSCRLAKRCRPGRDQLLAKLVGEAGEPVELDPVEPYRLIAAETL